MLSGSFPSLLSRSFTVRVVPILSNTIFQLQPYYLHAELPIKSGWYFKLTVREMNPYGPQVTQGRLSSF